jgi:hypothetical protein
MSTQNWGAKMPGFLEEAEAEVLKLEDDLAAARRRVQSLKGEMAGHEHMTREITRGAGWSMAELVAERDRLGQDRSGGHNLMGRYLALLDEIERREGA